MRNRLIALALTSALLVLDGRLSVPLAAATLPAPAHRRTGVRTSERTAEYTATRTPMLPTVREFEQTVATYPFSDPNPIPIVGKIYPYFRFDGFAATSTKQTWKVVELENEYLKVQIMPQIGGKIWNAIDKRTNRSFIYNNHVVKFRDIAMRGPWTSGGIEANYGIIGHTPTVSTPVDYEVRTNADESVTCIIGALDLLTRTPWRLEITLGRDDAAFRTSSFWYNASSLEQPYYTWMNAAISVRGNLQFIYPGTSQLGHDGEHGPWPISKDGRDLSWYNNNDFGGYKSYHVFGQATDFVGAYWHDDNFGMVRFAPRDEKAGKKLWIWGLSRQGMIWEQLLTDTDGQYAEVQSGRLFNQTAEQSTRTPFKHFGFLPHSADRWTEYWYPVANTNGIVAASRVGALNVLATGDRVALVLSPVLPIADTLVVAIGDSAIYRTFVERGTLQLFTDTVSVPRALQPRLHVTLGNGVLEYHADPRVDALSRPVDAPPAFDWTSAYGLHMRGKEALRERDYAAARALLDSALLRDPHFVPALADRALVAIREMDYREARRLTLVALSVDTYDGAANFYYGVANRKLGSLTDAKDGFEIAALSVAYRGAAWTELARMALSQRKLPDADAYAAKALGIDNANLDALGIAAVVARLRGDTVTHYRLLQDIERINPLTFFTSVERSLMPGGVDLATAAAADIRTELPEQLLLELASWYVDVGDSATAERILRVMHDQPEALFWRAVLVGGGSGAGSDSAAAMRARANAISPRFVFPFRPEIVPALRAAVSASSHWKPRYYLALALWRNGRVSDAATLLNALEDTPDFAPFYAVRATLPGRLPADAVRDLEHAAGLDSSEWRYGKLLAEQLIENHRAAEAAVVARQYYQRFPANYILGLTLARALTQSGAFTDADALLSQLTVLPYEGARDGHALYRHTKLMLAVDAISAKQWSTARARIAAARLWPERLGVGKPYDADTDERLEDWLLADIQERNGNHRNAVALWTRVADSPLTTGTASDVLPSWARARLGRADEASPSRTASDANRANSGPEGDVLSAWRRTAPAFSATLDATLDAINAPVGRTSATDSLRYGLGIWEADSLGNHRAVVRVTDAADAVFVRVPWRRRDTMPENVNVVIINALTQQRVLNVARLSITRENGDLVFQALTPGEYYLYYMPYTGTFKSNYPKITYRVPDTTAAEDWLQRHGLDDAAAARAPTVLRFPEATTVGFDAINEFSRFTPMDYIATADEIEPLRTRYANAAFLAFAEDRALSIRMTHDIPRIWAERGPFTSFTGSAKRGEYYPFQIGVWAFRHAVDSLRYQSSAFTLRGGSARIPASSITAFNLEGTDWSGQRFTRTLHVDSGAVQPLWFGVDVPANAVPGDYEGRITLSAKGGFTQVMPVTIRVANVVVANHGDDSPSQLTRLRWLNSQLAADDSVAAPYTAMQLSGNTVSLLGRSLTFGADGFPTSIQSYFSPNNTAIGTTSREILNAPVRLDVRDANNSAVTWRGAAPRVTKRAPGAVSWETAKSAGTLQLRSHATLEFDGTAEYTVSLKATTRTTVSNVRLEIPIKAEAAKYMMGLGQKGGYRPEDFHWTWEVAKKNQDAAWIGDVNAGLQFTLKDEHYVRPLNTNFYLSKPLLAPRSWANNGKGGCDIVRKGEEVLASCYSGQHVIEADDSLRFDFRLMITPFKPLDTKGQWGTRYFHAFVPVDSIQSRGANTVNVHHANRVNPWINYPFIETAAMRSYVDSAHASGLKAKIYYTVRELTNHAPELFALRSLGDEVLSHGPGGGYSWLQEHLGGDYIAAWHVPAIKDAAVVNSGVSRWHNFYIEGLDWLVKNEKIDGLYLDDVAFDRITMKRVRKTLDRGNPGALLDLHSANQYNPRDGFASSANLYLEHFPYINRLWFGEYFDYDSRPDYWLVEISGIPFGLMGEMLEKGGNPWRGMTMGMTARMPWSGDPAPLWKAWDDFGIQQSAMHGWWSGRDPVTTSDTSVLATTWTKPGSAMVSLGSWHDTDVTVRLNIDWKALGLDPARSRIRAPAIDAFQDAATWAPDALITVPGKKGLILIIEGR